MSPQLCKRDAPVSTKGKGDAQQMNNTYRTQHRSRHTVSNLYGHPVPQAVSEPAPSVAVGPSLPKKMPKEKENKIKVCKRKSAVDDNLAIPAPEMEFD